MLNRIKALREERGLSQEKLSELSGVSRQTIVTLERNEAANATLNTLSNIARALGVPIDNIFCAIEKENNDEE